MSGGSQEPEGPHDRKCEGCGLYYQDKGVSFEMHRASCTGGSSGDVQETSDPADRQRQQRDQQPQQDQPTGSASSSEDPTLGSGEIPESAKSGTVLPCGCYSIQEDKYDPGVYECDDCGQRFRIHE